MHQLRLRTAPIQRVKSKGRRRIRRPCAQSHSVTEEIRAASPISGRRIVSTLAWRFLGKWDGDPSSTRLTRLQHRRTSCSVGVIERTHRMTPHGCCTALPLLASQKKKRSLPWNCPWELRSPHSQQVRRFLLIRCQSVVAACENPDKYPTRT